jgi:DNA-binding MarR family transcriptional regulator
MVETAGIEQAAGLRRGVTRLGRRLRLEGPESGIPLLQLGTLGLLGTQGPMTPGELAAAQRVQPQSLSRTLTALEAEGLAVRDVDTGDRRRSRLTITDDGRQLLHQDMARRDRWLAAALARLSPTEQHVLVLAGRLMEQLAESPPTDSA